MPSSHQRGLRAVAYFEALKGVLVLAVGFGLLSFLGRDTEVFAERLVNRLHLNPAHHYPQIFIHAMADLSNSRLWLIAGFSAFYAAVRFTEAYGLWRERAWAEWLAALSAGGSMCRSRFMSWCTAPHGSKPVPWCSTSPSSAI